MSDSDSEEEQHREFKTEEDFDPDFFRDIERKSKIFRVFSVVHALLHANRENGLL